MIVQSVAQTQCINWGGNLAAIKSTVEDSLLLYSIPDLDTTFTCHIGLNVIDIEAGTNGSAFVWIDGSSSSYRNWGTLIHTFRYQMEATTVLDTDTETLVVYYHKDG